MPWSSVHACFAQRSRLPLFAVLKEVMFENSLMSFIPEEYATDVFEIQHLVR